MANKLKNLKVTSVDLVPLGANPDADIKIFKNRNPTERAEKSDTFWKRIQKAFSKATGIEPSDEVMKEIEKSVEVDCTVENIAKAMNESLASIKDDSILSTSQKMSLIHKSLMECADFIEKSNFYDENVGIKLNDKPVSESEETKKDTQIKPNNEKEKESDKMDVSKMSPEDKQLYEQLVKKYNQDQNQQSKPETNKLDKSVEKSELNSKNDKPNETDVNPEIKKALDEVEQLKKALEMQTLESVAKQYEILGKKTEELTPKLYELKKAGGTAYNDYIAILDEMKTAYQSSGIFKEIGSNNSGDNSIGGKLDAAVAEIKKALPKLSTAEAIVKACDDNPELKAMYESM